MSEKKIQPAKVEAVADLDKQFEGVSDYIFASYRGMTVEQLFTLRRQLRKENAEFKVVKNNFAKIVFRNKKADGLDGYFVGPTAVALARKDSGPVAKILIEFAKEVPTLEVKGGYIGGASFDAKQVEAFSKLPSKSELISMLMSTMNAPAQNLVYALNGVTTKLVRTLAAYEEKRKASGE
jgi:large subunit ribosomal protein L10